MIASVACIVSALLWSHALASAQTSYALLRQEAESARSQNQRTSVDDASQKSVPQRADSNRMTLPNGEDAWAVKILFGGGFTGTGRGDLMLDSVGNFTWLDAEGCNRKLSSSSMQPFNTMVRALNLSSAPAGANINNLCRDCYSTTLVIARRQAGIEKICTIAWDDSTQADVSGDVRELCEMLLSLRVCKH